MLEPPAGQISVIQTHIHQARAYTLYTHLSISCMIRAGTTVQYIHSVVLSELPSVRRVDPARFMQQI